MDTLESRILKLISLPELAYTYFASRYGIGYETLQIQWSIENNGSANLQRMVNVEAFSNIEQLDTYLLIPEGNAHKKIEFVEVESLSPDWRIVLRDTKPELGKNSALMTISPPLNYGEKMTYKMVEQLPEGLYAIKRTKEQLVQRKSEYDYCGWNINRPTKKVSLQVNFPPYFKPEIFSIEVRYASASGFPSERRHHDEEKRFRPSLELSPRGDSHILKLNIDYPMIGLIYIIRWLPVHINEPNSKRSIQITDISKQEYLRDIRLILTEKFDEGELKTLCFDLNIDYSSLEGEGKLNKARELVSFLERRNQIDNLLVVGKLQRPDILWPSPHDYK